ncbi:MAG: type II toxin-antitoxin system HipA family toxin [Clostridia bacterium]|nr:type II toxin-antitoxin system HipA family toxin [Clostridia bacterium]
MNIQTVKHLNVMYNGTCAGYLADLGYMKIGFQYTPEWIESGFSISPLSLPLTADIQVNTNRNFEGLHGVFADSFPDGWGQLLITRALRKQGINFYQLTPMTRLALVSSNGLGAFNYEPSMAENDTINMPDLDRLSEDVNKIFNDQDVPTENLDRILLMGGSSGGARPKAHLHIGDEDWIVKFPCRMDPPNIGRKEYAANMLAKACGIHINDCRLFPSKTCDGYFAAKRFDRNNGKRIHMISLSGILEVPISMPVVDYMHLFNVIERISAEQTEDSMEAFRRMCFNVLFHNTDDHSKNFSFVYDESKKGYRLSPAYDITRIKDGIQHQMMVCGNERPEIPDLMKCARMAHLPENKCKHIIKDMQERIKAALSDSEIYE